jgi:lipopolysaccharide export LptBFGC system permease protein LptF
MGGVVKKIDIYLAKLLLVRIGLVCTFLMVLIGFIDFLSYAKTLSQHPLPLSQFGMFLYGRMLRKLEMIIHFIFAGGLLWAIYRMQSSNELTILRVSGLSNIKIWKSFYIITTLVAIIYIFFLNGLATKSITKSEEIKSNIRNDVSKTKISFLDGVKLEGRDARVKALISMVSSDFNTQSKPFHASGLLFLNWDKADERIKCDVKDGLFEQKGNSLSLEMQIYECLNVDSLKTESIEGGLLFENLTVKKIRQKKQEDSVKNIIYPIWKLLQKIVKALKVSEDSSLYLLKVSGAIQGVFMLYFILVVSLKLNSINHSRTNAAFKNIIYSFCLTVVIYGFNIVVNSVFLIFYNGMFLPLASILTGSLYLSLTRFL